MLIATVLLVSATVRAWAKKQGLSLHQLQSHFNARIFANLKSRGKVAVGWDEILRGMGYDDDAAAVDSVVVQSWTGPGTFSQTHGRRAALILAC